jgi:hypothetical protein
MRGASVQKFRRSFIVLAVLALCAFVGAGCGKFGKIDEGGSKTPKDSDIKKIAGAGAFDAANRKKYDCGKIEELKNEGRSHVETTEHVKYKANPPASGNHWNSASPEAPLPWGVYSTEKQTEQWVHNLEHGHIVIVYKGISNKDKKKLLSQRDQVKYHLVVLPRAKNPKKGIYYIAWNHRVFCKHPSAAALQEMIDQYIDSGPELLMEDKSTSE